MLGHITGEDCATPHLRLKGIELGDVEEFLAAIDKDLVIKGRQRRMDALLSPRPAHGDRVIKNVSQAENDLRVRELMTGQLQRPLQLALHPERGVVDEKDSRSNSHQGRADDVRPLGPQI